MIKAEEKVELAVLEVVLDMHRLTLSGQRFENGASAREYHSKFKDNLLRKYDLTLLND